MPKKLFFKFDVPSISKEHLILSLLNTQLNYKFLKTSYNMELKYILL